MEIYVAGPMAGIPDLNRPAFAAAEQQLTDRGHKPINPHHIPPWQHVGPCPTSYATNPDGHAAACYLRSCAIRMLMSDAVLLLGGWPRSVGSVAELSIACPSGLGIFTDLAQLDGRR